MLNLRFHNISSSNRIAEELWQALLWIEADFSVELAEGLLLSEPNWCIVELANSIAVWLRNASENGPEFTYTSMDYEQMNLLWFRQRTNGTWHVGSAWQNFECTTPIPFSELQEAARQYVLRVLEESKPFLSAQTSSALCSSFAPQGRP